MLVWTFCLFFLYACKWVIPCQMDQNFKRLGHDPSQILMKLFQMKGIYEIRLSWKFQHKLITRSRVMTPQSWHGKLKIGKTRQGQAAWVHFWASITFFVVNPNFSNLLQFLCPEDSIQRPAHHREAQYFYLKFWY